MPNLILTRKDPAGATSALSTRVVYLTKAGAVSDADISDASTSFGTDNTAAIQAVLNQGGQSSPLQVVVDGTFSVTGLRVKSNTEISCLPGCGFILRPNSNYTLLENYDLQYDVALGYSQRNITIRGGIWNGNRKDNSLKASGTVGINCIFRFYGVQNLLMVDFEARNPACYTFHTLNCRRFVAERFVIDVGNAGYINQDGIHADGNCHDIVFRDAVINAHDDAIGFNADDQYLNPAGITYPYYSAKAAGPVTNVVVENIVLRSQLYGIRILSGSSRVDNIRIRNIRGYTQGYGVVIDNFWQLQDVVTQKGPGNIGTVYLEDINIAITGLSDGVRNSVINIAANMEHLVLSMRRTDWTQNVPSLWVHGTTTVIDNLTVLDYTSTDATATDNKAHLYLMQGTIKRLRLLTADLDHTGTAIDSPLLLLTDGAKIEFCQMGMVRARNINNVLHLVSNSTIQALSIGDLSHSGAGTNKASLQADSGCAITDTNLAAYYGAIIASGNLPSKRGHAFTEALPNPIFSGSNAIGGIPGGGTTTPLPTSAPNSPTALSVSGADGKAYLSWSAPVSGGAPTDYLQQYAVAGSNNWQTFAHVPSTATVTSILGLAAGSYDFRVAAVNAVGTSGYSQVVTATVTVAIPARTDTFERSDADTVGNLESPVGQPWKLEVGTFGIRGNTLQYLGSTSGIATGVTTDAGKADYLLDTTLRYNNGSTMDAALYFRTGADLTNTMVLDFFLVNGLVGLGKYINGEYTLLASIGVGFTTGSEHPVRVQCVGTQILIYLDGATAPNINYNTATGLESNTRFGLGAFQATADDPFAWTQITVS